MGVGLKKGKKLFDHWYVEEGDEDFDTLHELWASAKRQVSGVPEKLEALRELLRRGGRIGEDDIPF